MIKSHSGFVKAIALLLCMAVIITSFCLGNIGVEAERNFSIKYNGKDTQEVTLAQDSKILLTVDEMNDTAYKWQILVDSGADLWANISGQKDNFIYVSFATVGSVLDSLGKAYLRCVEISDGKTYTSSPVAVTVTYTVPEINEEQPTAKAVKSAPRRANASDTEQCTVTVEFVYENGDIAYDPWVATVAKGSDCDYTVNFPTVVGYLAYFGDETEPSTEYKFNISSVNEDMKFTVTYKPTVVSFSVRHLTQNVLDDHYTLYNTTEQKGLTGTAVGDKCDMDIPGFSMLYYDKDTKIAADGSTEIEVYYDRNYYLVTFDLDGGYGVEPVYARYETTVSIGKPTRPGYVFNGWELVECDGREATATEKNTYSLESSVTLPSMNLKYRAKWITTNTTYTVVYWAENADDDGYSYICSKTETATSAQTVSGIDDCAWSNANYSKDYFTYNNSKTDKNVTVEGDGSTVVNVYYTRNVYTLVFVGDENGSELTCTKEEHTHSDSCCKYGGTGLSHWRHSDSCCKLGKEEHTHSRRDGCYKKIISTITAKYGADIHGNFPIKDGDKTIWWTVPNGCKSFKSGTQLGSIDRMPGENITFEKDGSESGADIYYYIEALDGQSGTYTHDGKNFILYKTINLSRREDKHLTYSEEFHDIAGFTQWRSDPSFDKMEQGGKTEQINEKNYLCYTRNSYKLSFYNVNGFVSEKEANVQYEASLKGYYFEPDYPEKLETNAYEFAGWYTTPECFAGSEVDFNTAIMPAADVTLYAKWAPKTHNVKIYKTSQKTELLSEQNILHGSLAKAPDGFSNGSYVFDGWFYIDADGEKNAFDFNNMPIHRDMEIFAEWSSKTAVLYTVYYKDENGVEIADPTVGTALVGTSKTFSAKGGNELYQGYREGYFPNTNSHTILMDIDGTKNEYTFIYIQKESVPYTVRYLEKDTNKVLKEEKHIDTKKSVVSEIFVQISGYMPDAYQKRLVLSANEAENVITFWYTKDDEHAYYLIVHWVQNLDGNGYSEYRSVQGPGKIGETFTETPLNLTGYTYNAGKSSSSGKITENGLELNLYYDRNEYPYTVKYLEYGTNKVLHPEKTSAEKYRYGKVVMETAEDIAGYTVVGDNTKTRTIKESENEIIFYYTEQQVKISYVPVGNGKVSISSESVNVATGNAGGSTPLADKGYRFDGWFEDENCTVAVNGTWVDGQNKLVPQKQNGLYKEKTYYAKFVEDKSTLTIKKTGSEEIDENQTFIFRVTGTDENTKNIDLTVTVHGNGQKTVTELPVGEYSVEEITSWSWRYAPDETVKQVNVAVGGSQVEFKNKREKTQWLNGDSYSVNNYK